MPRDAGHEQRGGGSGAAAAQAEVALAATMPDEVPFAVAPAGHEVDDDDFCDMLLAALVAVASRSKRRQADLSAALRRNRLQASPERVQHALAELQAASCIREVVPLYDGGTLVTVTNMGMDLLGKSAHWRFLQELNGGNA